ncbi:putative F-box domain-containing protein [Helianthus anomalus]
MGYLPFDVILFEILIRLNERSIDLCRCVCREWRHGLSSWEFVWRLYAENYLEKLLEDSPSLDNVVYEEHFSPEIKYN